MGKFISMQKKVTGKTVDEAFNEFIQYGKAKNLSEATIDFYERYYQQFKEFLNESEIEETNEINKVLIDRMVIYLGSKLSNAISMNSYIRAVRAFLYYCMKMGYVEQFQIQQIKAEKKVKETYTDEELRMLLDKPNIKKCSFAEYRNWVIINYLLSTGNRLTTVINVKIQDVDFENCNIILKRTKNRSQQVIPLSKTLALVLQEYISYRQGQPEDYLFCTVTGEKLQKHAIEGAVRKFNKSRGVNKTSLHLFRHTFAKKWILSGGDIFRLQKMLGHSSLDMVKEYVSMFADDLKQDFDKFNPLEQISGYKKVIKMR